MEKNKEGIVLGVCYYPEHWPKDQWRDDLLQMRQNGIELIRVGEFSWSITEPEEGKFDYSFWDEFLDITDELKMPVIFGTPSATPPAWLSHNYPEILNCNRLGIPYTHGGRRHFNYNSEVYRKFVARITEKCVQHYGARNSVIGWQIDNELNCEIDEFYSRADDEAFRVFLQEKYGSLKELNRSWGTVFWNQTYSDWQQVHIPANVPHNTDNPHQKLDFYRFISASACSYAKMQSDIIRKYKKPGDFVTTNGWFENLNSHQLTRESLDFFSYDNYPNFAYELCEDPLNNQTLNDRKWSKYLSEVRSISPNFAIMEQQSGENGWSTSMETIMPKPGQIRLWTMQSIAHGGDLIVYFRWRTCTFGTEIYWHGILDYSGRENRRLKEVKETAELVQKISEAAGAKYEAKFAVLADYDNLFDSKADRWHGLMEKESYKGIFTAAQLLHCPMDYLYLEPDITIEDLQKYSLLFYPHGLILDERRAYLLQEYVQKGGTLVLGARCGQKDMDGHCVTDPLPGLMRDFCGVDVVDFTLVQPNCPQNYIQWEEKRIPAAIFNDILEPLNCKCEKECEEYEIQNYSSEPVVEGFYTEDYYKGKAGVISRKAGQGKVYYFGAAFSTEAAEMILQKLGYAKPYGGILELPRCCELAVRKKNNISYYFVLNYSGAVQQIELYSSMYDMEKGTEVSGKIFLEPYGCFVGRR